MFWCLSAHQVHVYDLLSPSYHSRPTHAQCARHQSHPALIPLHPQTRQAPHFEHCALVQQTSAAAVATSRHLRSVIQPDSSDGPHQQSQENTGSHTTSAACLSRETPTWSAWPCPSPLTCVWSSTRIVQCMMCEETFSTHRYLEKYFSEIFSIFFLAKLRNLPRSSSRSRNRNDATSSLPRNASPWRARSASGCAITRESRTPPSPRHHPSRVRTPSRVASRIGVTTEIW